MKLRFRLPTPRNLRAHTVGLALAAAAWMGAAQPAPTPAPATESCVGCHARVTPQAVADWKLSKHASAGVACDVCHGDRHHSAADADQVQLPTPDTCAACHTDQVAQFKRGKHALAWTAMQAMPTAHWQPLALMGGQKGCGGCHKIGLKSDDELRALKTQSGGFGVASCDACHTRHVFSVAEARQPQACQTCHMGFDHPQWEMYSSSKHGVRSELKQKGLLDATAAAPTCQTCHMTQGRHDVRTAWGFLGLRLPLPADPQWSADRVTILQALGVLDSDGKPTPRLEAVKAADMVRLTEEDWQQERARMLAVCRECHSERFARQQLEQGDELLRQADHLMAEAIRSVAGLYADGVLARPAHAGTAFPDLLTFHDAATVIEQRLFVMFLEHRMRTFQGSFHASPDYALWYGWSELQRDLLEIKERAAELRREHTRHAPTAKPRTPARP